MSEDLELRNTNYEMRSPPRQNLRNMPHLLEFDSSEAILVITST
jgi:hypothetical protein